MGIKNSKLKLRRRRSRRDERLNPEGSPSESNPPHKANDAHHEHYEYEVQKPAASNTKQADAMLDLRVNLPPHHTNNLGCTPLEDTKTQTDKCAEWRLSLPRDTNDQSRNEKISRLMNSIRDVVGSEMEAGGESRSAIRVRLSVTPEPRSRCHVNDDCEPTRSTSSRHHHYEQIPGGEEDSANRKKPAANEKDACASRDHRQKTGHSANQSRSQSRDHPENSRCRRHCRGHANRDKLKSDRFQSPYDRSFQEAMYLRLKELQRETTRQRCRAEDPDMADTDIDDNVVASKDDSDSEYSGDDDNCVLSGKTEKQCSRMFEPLSTLSLKHGKAETLPTIFNKTSVNSPTRTSNRHHPDPDHLFSSLAANDGLNLVAKPWDETQLKLQTGKRKTLKKKRSSAGGSKPSHGYLRENALSKGGIGTFPNIPKTDSKKQTEETGKATSPSQKHEHFHYHYYYCKPHT